MATRSSRQGAQKSSHVVRQRALLELGQRLVGPAANRLERGGELLEAVALLGEER
jgi:hypothetical protein